ncbi:MAG: ABC transporter substrate-binding protein [Alphaproteobacteria bacterium]|nr:ABC transporter substrate-binding protein [Alphaproteobacteria bacterium]
MTTNSDTNLTPIHMTVARHSPSRSRWAAQEAALEFGRFQILPRRRQLIADGAPVKLGTRALDILLVLLEAEGSLVTKEELFSRVWPGIHVSEENLKVQIFALRQALGEDRDFIRTETGRGYRFMAAVKSAASRSASLHAARRWQRQRRRTMSRWATILAFPKCSDQTAYLPAVRRSRLCATLALATGIALGTFCYTAHAAPSGGSGTVKGLYDTLLSTMKNGRTLGGSGRFAQLAPVIRSSFDVASMARLSVGPFWAGLSEAQRQEVTESYGRYISAIYTDRFDSYNGQKLEVTGEEPAAFGLLVKSRIIKSNGEPVEVDYLMRRNGESWLVADIYLDSAISEVATRRSEFAAILKTQGIDGLIAALNRKADILSGTTASSF